MKIQFCKECIDPMWSGSLFAEFDVVEAPTEEKCKAIEDEIFEVMGKYELEHGDYEEFDWWGVCYATAKKYLKIVENPVVKTFYL
jgi:hypothetical protein